MSVTYVTGFFDCFPDDPNNRLKYLSYFKILNRIKDPMVIFVQPDLVEMVQKIVEGKRLIVPQDIGNLKTMEWLSKFKLLPPISNPVNNKTDPIYCLTTLAKPFLVTEVVKLNPFGTSRYAWIDFGIGHILDLFMSDFRELSESLTDQLRLVMLRPVSVSEVQDRDTYYSLNRGIIAGGYFGGAAKSLVDFQNKVTQELERVSYRVTEEQVFGAIAAEGLDHYSYIYSDYLGIVANCKYIKTNLNTVLHSLIYAQKYNLNIIGTDIARKIFDSCLQGLKIPSHEQVMQWLYSGLICSYYVDKDFARKLADVISVAFNFKHLVQICQQRFPNMKDNLKFIHKEYPMPVDKFLSLEYSSILRLL